MLNLLSYFAETDKYFIKVLERNEDSEVVDVRFKLCNFYKVKATVLNRPNDYFKYYFHSLLILKEHEEFEDHELKPGIISNYVVTGDFLKETGEAADDIRQGLRKEIIRNLEEIIPNLSKDNSCQEVNLIKYRSKQNA